MGVSWWLVPREQLFDLWLTDRERVVYRCFAKELQRCDQPPRLPFVIDYPGNHKLEVCQSLIAKMNYWYGCMFSRYSASYDPLDRYGSPLMPWETSDADLAVYAWLILHGVAWQEFGKSSISAKAPVLVLGPATFLSGFVLAWLTWTALRTCVRFYEGWELTLSPSAARKRTDQLDEIQAWHAATVIITSNEGLPLALSEHHDTYVVLELPDIPKQEMLRFACRSNWKWDVQIDVEGNVHQQTLTDRGLDGAQLVLCFTPVLCITPVRHFTHRVPIAVRISMVIPLRAEVPVQGCGICGLNWNFLALGGSAPIPISALETFDFEPEVIEKVREAFTPSAWDEDGVSQDHHPGYAPRRLLLATALVIRAKRLEDDSSDAAEFRQEYITRVAPLPQQLTHPAAESHKRLCAHLVTVAAEAEAEAHDQAWSTILEDLFHILTAGPGSPRWSRRARDANQQ